MYLSKNQFSQEVNGFNVKAKTSLLVPYQSNFHIRHSDNNIDGYHYEMDVKAYNSFGYSLSGGYEWNVKSFDKTTLLVPVQIKYSLLNLKQEQNGYYTGGVAGLNFNGIRKLKLKLNLFSVSSGLVLTQNNSVETKIWQIEFLLSAYLNTYNYFKVDETVINCNYCKENDYSFKYRELGLFGSTDLQINRLYKLKRIYLGPSLGISYFIVYDPSGFNLNYTNLPEYSLLELGLKIKL